jgi:leucyl aminopeptidase
MLDVFVVSRDSFSFKTELLAMGVFKDELNFFNLSNFSSGLEKIRQDLFSSGEFNANIGITSLLHSNDTDLARKILLIGLGNKQDFTPESARISAGKVTQKVRRLGLKEFSIFLTSKPSTEIVSAIAEGIKLASYSFNKYKTVKEPDSDKEIEKSYILVDDYNQALANVVKESSIISDSVNFARDLGNLPPNECSPAELVKIATELFAISSRIRVRIIEATQLTSNNLNGIFAVGTGSSSPPKLIIIEYLGRNHGQKDFLILGKAVTFDTGGISLKPSEKMDEMKFDKCGGCNVIAIMKALDRLSLPLDIIGIIPAVENMPSGSSYRPGDIIRMHNGKTVEIVNTDAEGRIIMADALSYGVNMYSPKAIVDMATLTGAAIIALGSNVAALLGNDQKLADKILSAANLSGEKIWQLPIFEEHKEQIKSTVADIKNIGGRPAGAITAAAFLSHFVGNTPWVHLDIAGTAWFQEGSIEKSYIVKGATGFAVRTILKLLTQFKI